MVVSRNILKQRKVFIVYGILGIFLLIGLGRVFFPLRNAAPREWFERSISGIVVGRGNSSLSVKDARGKVSLFEISSSTPIIEGRKHISIDDVGVGEYVIVETSPSNNGSKIRVLSIRVLLSESMLKSPKQERP